MITTLDVLSKAYDRCTYGYNKVGDTEIDYASFGSYKQEIKNQDNWFEMELNPFGSEGIYIDIFFCQDYDIETNNTVRQYCGTIKTLMEDRVAFRDMGALMGEMMYWGNKIIRNMMKE